jgi:hypothetical protein
MRFPMVLGPSLLFVLGTVGCSSSGPGTPSDEELRGSYSATTDGAMLELTFSDETHYAVQRSTCDNSSPCQDTGTYALNAAHTALSLTSATTGGTVAVPFSILAAVAPGPGGTAAQALRPLTGGGLTSGDGGALSGDGGTALVKPGAQLVKKFSAGGQNFQSTTPLDDSNSYLVSVSCSQDATVMVFGVGFSVRVRRGATYGSQNCLAEGTYDGVLVEGGDVQLDGWIDSDTAPITQAFGPVVRTVSHTDDGQYIEDSFKLLAASPGVTDKDWGHFQQIDGDFGITSSYARAHLTTSGGYLLNSKCNPTFSNGGQATCPKTAAFTQ